MIGRSVGALAARTLHQVLDAACGCAARQWRVDVSGRIGGVILRAEIRPE